MRERTIENINQRLEMYHLFLQVAGKIRKNRDGDPVADSAFFEGRDLAPSRSKRRLQN